MFPVRLNQPIVHKDRSYTHDIAYMLDSFSIASISQYANMAIWASDANIIVVLVNSML